MIPATVRWFDSLRGEGLARLSDGRSVYLHFTAIEGVNKHNYSWPHDDDHEFLSSIKDRECTVTLYNGFNGLSVYHCVFGGK